MVSAVESSSSGGFTTSDVDVELATLGSPVVATVVVVLVVTVSVVVVDTADFVDTLSVFGILAVKEIKAFFLVVFGMDATAQPKRPIQFLAQSFETFATSDSAL